MVVITSIFFGSLIALTSATPLTARSGMVVHGSKSDVPEGFTHQGAAPADKSLPLRIALVQNNMSGLEKVLHDVSSPNSPNYGKHLSKEQVYIYIYLYCRRV